jgi:hypothetical protein
VRPADNRIAGIGAILSFVCLRKSHSRPLKLCEVILHSKALFATAIMDTAGIAEELLRKLRLVLPDATFPLSAALALVESYSESPVPERQTRAALNDCIRRLGLHSTPPLRAQLVIFQILLYVINAPLQVRSPDWLCSTYRFPAEEVQDDESLALFDSYMALALRFVEPKNQMNFIILDVVVPLSEATVDAQSRRRPVPGGGTETAETRNRYYIYECRTGHFRPKTVELGRHLWPEAALYRVDQTASTSPVDAVQQGAQTAGTNPAATMPFGPPVPSTVSSLSYAHASLRSEEMNPPIVNTMHESAQAAADLHGTAFDQVIDFLAQDSESESSGDVPGFSDLGHVHDDMDSEGRLTR